MAKNIDPQWEFENHERNCIKSGDVEFETIRLSIEIIQFLELKKIKMKFVIVVLLLAAAIGVYSEPQEVLRKIHIGIPSGAKSAAGGGGACALI